MQLRTKKIISLGPEGSYAQIAANKAINTPGLQERELVLLSSITKVIEEIQNDANAIGVVPIENSIEGIVRESVDNLLHVSDDIRIFAELMIPISHCLISKSDDISKIQNVISYTQGLAQCRHYIAKNLPENATVIRASSTSEAVKSLKDFDSSYAAIGTDKAAEIYGFNILERNINDEKDNKTRFICINRIETNSTGNDKTSIALSTSNEPGALVSVLNIFKKKDLNMSYIESRPSKRVFGEYTFFIDLDGHSKDEKVMEALNEIKPFVHFYKFLGSYPKCPID